MRAHEDVLFIERRMPPSRKHPNGRSIWYYKLWVADGRYSGRRTTGRTTEKSAGRYLHKLISDGKIRLMAAGGMEHIKDDRVTSQWVTFGDLANDFWQWDGKYVKDRLEFDDPDVPRLTQSTCRENERSVRLHLLTGFKDRPLSAITPTEIEQFSISTRKMKGLSGKTINNTVSVMRTMLKEAHRQGVKLAFDPYKKNLIRNLGEATKVRGILTYDEAQRLFTEDVWTTERSTELSSRLYRAMSLTAGLTGLRMGELLGLKDHNIHESYIELTHSWVFKTQMLGPTKTKKPRTVPLLPVAREAIEEFTGRGEFIFSHNGSHPATPNLVTEALYKALGKIGIREEDRHKRGLTFHGWRHWLISTLRAKGGPKETVMLVAGHTQESTTDGYTHLGEDAFKPMVKALGGLLS